MKVKRRSAIPLLDDSGTTLQSRPVRKRNGVDANRIVPAGVGPLAPVASNATEKGQAQNRRVELVQR